jgi:16S rRNA U516 pseudouridylate synthase RsuA-like enzyme
VGRAEAGPGEEETGAAAAHGESRKAAKKRARAEEKPVRLKVVIREGKNRQVRGLLLSLATD